MLQVALLGVKSTKYDGYEMSTEQMQDAIVTPNSNLIMTAN